jgi:tetratricopeptide (TPR) repeat protein
MRSSARSLAKGIFLLSGLLLVSGCAALDMDKMSTALPSGASVDSKLAFARLCERHGELDQAQLVYEGVLKQDPANQQACHRLGVVNARQGNYQEAEQLLTKAAELRQPDAELLSDLGYTYYLQDRLDMAEKLLRQAIEKSSNYHAAWTNLGLTLGQQGRFEESLAAFLKAGTPAEAHASLGYVLAQQNQFRRAQEEFRTSLSLNPDLHSAAQGLLLVSSRIPGQQPVSVASTTARRKSNPQDSAATNNHDTAVHDASRASSVLPPNQSGQAASAAQESNPATNPFSWANDLGSVYRPSQDGSSAGAASTSPAPSSNATLAEPR